MFDRCQSASQKWQTKMAVKNGSQHHWDNTFIKSHNGWEEESILNLLSLLAYLDVEVHHEGDDNIV